MKNLFIISCFLFSINAISQSAKEEISITQKYRDEIKNSSQSAFMQYSGFVPRTIKELLTALSGDKATDSLLMQMDKDSLSLNASAYFDPLFRKDFALRSVYSPTLNLFFKYNLYDEQLVKKAIVLIYFSYLTEDLIPVQEITTSCLKGNRKANKKAKKRLNKELKSRHKN